MQFDLTDSIQLLRLFAAPQSVVTVQEFPEELWGVVVPTCGDAELCIPAESGLGPDCLQLLLAGLALAQARHKREPLFCQWLFRWRGGATTPPCSQSASVATT